MDEEQAITQAIDVLRRDGARFAYLHGSRVTGTASPGADVDIAAWFGEAAIHSHDVLVPIGVDLMVLDHAPLELRGRVAHLGKLLFSDDETARVRWEATTRKIYFDELPRIQRAHREFSEAVRRGR